MEAERKYAKGLGRAFGGALLFVLPLLMTMEMWSLGGTMPAYRMLIFVLLSLPLLLGLSYFAGFEDAFRLKAEVLDAGAAFAVGVILSTVFLGLFGVLQGGLGDHEAVGKIALAATPAAMGALLASKQMGQQNDDEARDKSPSGLTGELFIMLAGALFLSFNMAPTEEMVLIAYKMSPVHALAVVAASLLVLHLFVYQLGFPGEDGRLKSGGALRTFAAFTAAGYAIAVGVSAYCLWTFGRFDGASDHEKVMMIVALSFPAALGAATARLVI